MSVLRFIDGLKGTLAFISLGNTGKPI